MAFNILKTETHKILDYSVVSIQFCSDSKRVLHFDIEIGQVNHIRTKLAFLRASLSKNYGNSVMIGFRA